MTSVGVLAHSAKTLGGGLEELRKTLATYGINDPKWREVPKSRFVPEQVEKLLKKDVELIFVWGGDGTVQRVIDAVAGVPVALAILRTFAEHKLEFAYPTQTSFTAAPDGTFIMPYPGSGS